MAWLGEYTFPREARHADLALANAEYQKLIRRLIANGTTTALYFGSLWLEPTKLLADLLHTVMILPDWHANNEMWLCHAYTSCNHPMHMSSPRAPLGWMQAGQRAHVGLVCMDRNSKGYYTKSTQQNLQDTEAFIRHVRSATLHKIAPT